MRRRVFLSLCPAIVAGCTSASDPETANFGGKNYTAPADVTVYDEPKPIPDPPDPASVKSARDYLKTYEEHRIYNELLGRNVSEAHEGHVSTGGERDVVALDVEPVEIELVRATDHGYYFVTAVSGKAEHWCSYDPPRDESRNCGSGSGRNNGPVVHLVDSAFHKRIPYNWYTCTGPEEPYESPRESENVGSSHTDSAAQFQVYDVSRDEHAVDLTVRFVDGSTTEQVYSESVDSPPYLTVVAEVARRTGTYEIEAALADGRSETFEWEITGDGAPSWTSTSLFVTPTGDVWMDVIDPDADLKITPTSCPDAADRRSE